MKRMRRHLTINAIPLTYVAESWFLQDLVRHLTPGPDEEMAYVTGPALGKLRILSRICGITPAQQSPVYALGKARSCADALIEMLDKGSPLHSMAHSHPGVGPQATFPSSIDVRYLGGIQRASAEAVGIIVTRDGCVRFFSVCKP